jgi:hypothetical protein
MLQHLIFAYRFNLDRARVLVSDLSDEQMVLQPHGVINHPAWTLGHLAATSNSLAGLLGLESTFPDAWRDACRTGGTPDGDAAAFPSKGQLLEQLAHQHERVGGAIETADPALFAREHPHPRARARFPTIGDTAAFLMSVHEANHLGQITAWRRAVGLGPATGH